MTETASRTLASLADRFFHAQLAASPIRATTLGIPGYDAEVPDPSRDADQARVRDLELLATELKLVTSDSLDPSELVTYRMLTRLVADRVAGLVAALGEVSVSGTVASPHVSIFSSVPIAALTSAERAEAYLERLGKLGGYFDALVERYLAAASDGRHPTAAGVCQAVEQLDAYLGSDVAGDPLLGPTLGDGVDPDVWRRCAADAVETVVRPAVRRLRDALETELVPVGRDDAHVGVCHVPGGEGGYLAAVRAHTTTALTPEQIHNLGLSILGELREEFAEIGGRSLGTGDVPEILRRLRDDPALRFNDAAQIVECVTDALRRAQEALPDAFRAYDIAPCVVEEIPAVTAKDSVLAYYQAPASDGARPGTHFVNTYRPEIRARFEYEALAFHESVPGHHLQIAVAQRLTDLPDFRRFGSVTAYVEGWALYTERLADEMGLYTSDIDRLGMLSCDAWRASRLVVDTGIHHLGWSRKEAVDFMYANTALTESNINNEVDRYIAWPGQALSYMIGRIHLRQLRVRAGERFGADFDLATFHDRVLSSGPVPLEILDELALR